jgi:hypothetical protein
VSPSSSAQATEVAKKLNTDAASSTSSDPLGGAAQHKATKRLAATAEIDNEPNSKRRRINAATATTDFDELGDDWLERPLLSGTNSSPRRAKLLAANKGQSPAPAVGESLDVLDGGVSNNRLHDASTLSSSALDDMAGATDSTLLTGGAEPQQLLDIEQQHIDEEQKELATIPQQLQSRIAQVKATISGADDQAIMAIQNLLSGYSSQFVCRDAFC